MRGRFGWIGAGILLLGVVAILAAGFALSGGFGGTNLLAGTDADKTDRAVEPTGAEQDPPKAAAEPEKEEPKKDEAKKDEAKKDENKEEAKKDEPDEELSDKEQANVAENFSAPRDASAEASASAVASAPADTTMTLEIPAIGLSVPVYEGTGEASLSAGTGHLSGTGYPWVPESNTYIAGHRIGYPGTASDYVFWDLPSLAVGDEVYLTDANGRTYTYAVTEMLEVPITDLSVTAPVPGRDVVSLQTCIENYGDYWTPGPNWYVRYVVRADKVA